MEYRKDELVNGETVPCSYTQCGRPVLMTIARKALRKRCLAQGKVFHTYCTPYCRYKQHPHAKKGPQRTQDRGTR